jgi:hypothetical protein
MPTPNWECRPGGRKATPKCDKRAKVACPARGQMSAPLQIAHFRVTVRLGEGGMGYVYRCGPQKQDPSLRSLLRETIFVMQAAEHGSLHHSVSDRQLVSVLGGREMLRDGLRQTRA